MHRAKIKSLKSCGRILNVLLLLLFSPLFAHANECWKTPEGKEVCEHPKPEKAKSEKSASEKAPEKTQFMFKDSSSSIDPKELYEENHSVENDYFPQGAIKAARDNEMREYKRVESAERAIREDRETLEDKKRLAMEEIQKAKIEMTNHLLKQEKLSEEVEVMKDELLVIQSQQSDVAAEAKALEKKLNSVSANHAEANKNLRASQQKLSDQADALRRKRLDTEARVSQMKMEIQQSLSKIARDQTLIAQAETEKAQYETQEIHIAGQLSALLARKKEIGEARERATFEMAQIKKRLNAIQDDYSLAKKENDSLEKELKLLTSKTEKERTQATAEIQVLERKILAAKDSKFKNDSERSRLLAEAERMKTQLVDVQKRYDKVAAEEAASSLAVMESRVEFETAKSELNTKESNIESLRASGRTTREQIRNVAALAATSDMLESQQKVKVVKACKVFAKPQNSIEYNGRLIKGSIIAAAPASDGFYKVLNTSGTAQFVYQTCVEVVE